MRSGKLTYGFTMIHFIQHQIVAKNTKTPMKLFDGFTAIVTMSIILLLRWHFAHQENDRVMQDGIIMVMDIKHSIYDIFMLNPYTVLCHYSAAK